MKSALFSAFAQTAAAACTEFAEPPGKEQWKRRRGKMKCAVEKV
jgi:hypothetical protein